MPDLYKMGDVILLKQPPVGELSTIEDKLFLAAMNYMDTVRDPYCLRKPPHHGKQLFT